MQQPEQIPDSGPLQNEQPFTQQRQFPPQNDSAGGQPPLEHLPAQHPLLEDPQQEPPRQGQPQANSTPSEAPPDDAAQQEPAPTEDTSFGQAPAEDSPSGAAPITSAPQDDSLASLERLAAQTAAQMAQLKTPPPRRSASTEAAYLRKVRQLYNATVRSKSRDPDEPVPMAPIDLVEHLLAKQQSGWSKDTFSLNRSALLWWLSQKRKAGPEFLSAYQRLASTRFDPQTRVSSRRTHANSKRLIPLADFNVLLNVLARNAMRKRREKSAMNWAACTQWWLHAGLSTGLRPNEWEFAYWANDQKTVLMAPNSKRKIAPSAFNRAGNGKTVYDEPEELLSIEQKPLHEQLDPSLQEPSDIQREPNSFRAIPIEEGERKWIDLHLQAIAKAKLEKEVPFHEYYEHCRQTLRRACESAFGQRKRYSFYTLRRQFSANAKAAMPLGSVAELMGHTDPTNKTTKRNYGHRNQAHGGMSMLDTARDTTRQNQANTHSDHSEDLDNSSLP